ncbi:hypothetical protein Tco_0946771, partial [Tanacetum coccineum]
MNENELNDIHMNKSEVFESVSDRSVNESEEDNNQVNDRYKAGEGYHAVPPPYTRNFMPPRPDLSFAGLDDSVFKSAVNETVTSVHESETSASKTSKESMEKHKSVRSSAPLIEDWESDSDDDYVIRPSVEQNKPSYAKINSVKLDENTRKLVIEQHTYKQAENLRKSQSSRVDKRNWNGMMTQKLRDDFEFKKKACFVCGSLNHLIKDYNFYESKMVGKFVFNNKGKATGQREVRPVWNNAQRVNHQNFSNNLTHPHPRRNFVPSAVMTNSGKVPVNTAKQSFPRAAISTSTARYVNTAASRPTVNGAKPSSNVFHKSHSPVKRTFNQITAPKNSNLKEKVNIAKVNNATTVEPKAVVSVVQGHKAHAVKASASWIWRPKQNLLDHGNLQHALKDQGIVDSGCSTHMTGSKAYLSDYQEINGGFVAFRGSPKGGSGLEWLFDIDSLTKSMNYELVTAGNQTNGDASIETNVNSIDNKDADEVLGKGDDDVSQKNGQEKEVGATNKEDDQHVQDFRAKLDSLIFQQKEGYANSTNKDSTASPSVSTARPSINTVSKNINTGSPNINTASPIPNDSSMQSLE